MELFMTNVFFVSLHHLGEHKNRSCAFFCFLLLLNFVSIYSEWSGMLRRVVDQFSSLRSEILTFSFAVFSWLAGVGSSVCSSK